MKHQIGIKSRSSTYATLESTLEYTDLGKGVCENTDEL